MSVMGKGYRESVGGIIRPGCFLQVQQVTDHQLYLMFIRLTVPGNRIFDFGWRIFSDSEAGIGQSQNQYPSRLSDADRCRDIPAKEYFFHGSGIWTVFFQ